MNVEKVLFKRVDHDVSGLLKYIEMGDIGLPDIQRPFVWRAAKVRDLFDSMYRGFPVGYLLFWENANMSGAKAIGFGEKPHLVPARLIVDGQQRLTSLYSVMRGVQVLDANYRKTRIEIAFRPRDGRFDVSDAAIRKDPEWIPTVSALWSSGKGSWSFITAFIEGLRAKREVSADEADTISRNLDRLFDLQTYPLTALEIAPTVTEEEVADIFVRINSLGAKLNQADFILTLMSVFWDEGRADLERFCREARVPSTADASPFNYFIQPQPDQLLRAAVAYGFRRARLETVYSILRGKDLETGQFSAATRDTQFGLLHAAQASVLDLLSWHEFWKVPQAAGFLDASMISSQTNLIYGYALFLIGRHEHSLGWWELRQLMARWLFMTALTGRYSGSSETIMDQDLNRLKQASDADAFVRVIQGQIEDALTEDYWRITLPNALVSAGARSPYLFAYQAALNLLDARALFSKDKVQTLFAPGIKAKKSPLERHHLFPKAYLQSIGIDASVDANQIANMAIIGWEVNGAISDDPPSKYWPDWVHRFSSGLDDLATMRYWHALPEGWESMAYEEFLETRRRLMAAVIRDGFLALGDAPHSMGESELS